MSTMAFVQARMGSTRLPGKVLESLAGRPALIRIVERLQAVTALTAVVVVTSELPGDDVIAELCHQQSVRCFRGSEDDVLDRFHRAAQAHEVDWVVRVTSDCPLIDPGVLAELLEMSVEVPGIACASVATGAIGPERGYKRFPDGLDAESFTAEALEAAWREAADPYEREHVTPFIWRQPERFGVAVLEAPEDLGEERWTVDYPEDLELVRTIYDRLQERTSRPFGYREVLDLLDREPGLRSLNAERRAGVVPRAPL